MADLIGDIYEAALFPERWTRVLEKISEVCGFWGGAITWDSGAGRNWIATPEFMALLEEFTAQGWADRNERLDRAIRQAHFSFIHDSELFTAEERSRLPIYSDFLTPRGFGHGAATLINSPSHTGIAVTFERKLDRGGFTSDMINTLDNLRPHFARSLALATDVEKQKADIMVSGLSAVGAPAAVLRGCGKILAANSQFDRSQGRISFLARDKIYLRDDGTNRLLRNALSQGTDGGVRSIPIPGDEIEGPCVLHIIPLCRDARDFSPNGKVIIVLANPADTNLDFSLLKMLYDLTLGEARVLGEIQKGRALPVAAKNLGISYETVRSVAKSIYAKTGSSGQADLVRRLSVLNRYVLPQTAHPSIG